MAEDELLRPVFRKEHRERSGAFIRQVPVVGRDAPLEIDRIRSGAQKLRIVVGLDDGTVHTAERCAHGIRHDAEVGAKAEMRRAVEPVATASGRVVRRRKRRHAHIAEAKRRIRRDLMQTSGRQLRTQRSAHGRQRIHRHGVVPQQHCKPLDMIGVLMRDKHARERVRRHILRRESGTDAPRGDAGVKQNMGIAVGHERAVAARAAGKQCNVHSAAATHCSASSRSSTMSAPMLRSLPTKFS